MKKIKVISIVILAFLFTLNLSSCKKDKKMKFGSAKIAVTFGGNKSLETDKINLTKQTPSQYLIALKSITLAGHEGTSDHVLFNEATVQDAQIFDFTSGSLRHNLTDEDIPEGDYHAFRIELYYLQMKLQISTTNRNVETRNMRIYYTTDGTHKPGDVIQVADDGTSQGWLFGENQMPDFDPVTPRLSAYTYNGDGTSWYLFGDKNGQNYGPFGNMAFWSSASSPYSVTVPFTFEESDGEAVVMDFNVNQCWQFEDINEDGNWGGQDLTPEGTAWHMNFPSISIHLE